METDIGNPIDYKSEVDSLDKHAHAHDNEMNDDPYEDSTPIYAQPMMNQAPPPPPPMYPMMQQQWQPMTSPPTQPMDIFASIDKTTYIIVFIGFILGFFMGKTMQPVILKPS